MLVVQSDYGSLVAQRARQDVTDSMMRLAQLLCAWCRVHPIVCATMRRAKEGKGQGEGAKE
jgi:hypothetical protein